MILLSFLMGLISGLVIYDTAKIIARQDSHYKRQIKKREGKK